MVAPASRWRICSALTEPSRFVGESGMLCLTRIRPGAAAVAALLCLGVGAAAQQLPPAPGPIPPVRRGADGRIELAPPVQAPATVTKPPRQQPETRSAPSAAAPSTAAPS